MHRLGKCKFIFLMFVLGLFCLSATSALLVWHVISEHHEDSDGRYHHHDSENCPVCQSVIFNSSSVLVPSSDVVLFGDVVEYNIEYLKDAPIVLYLSQCIIPRAPPA